MDTDEYTCGTCKHGNLFEFCSKCEADAEKVDIAIQARKDDYHKRNDARAFALQLKQPNNGDFV